MSSSDSNKTGSYTWLGVLLVCAIVAVAIFLPRAFRDDPARMDMVGDHREESVLIPPAPQPPNPPPEEAYPRTTP